MTSRKLAGVLPVFQTPFHDDESLEITAGPGRVVLHVKGRPDEVHEFDVTAGKETSVQVLRGP